MQHGLNVDKIQNLCPKLDEDGLVVMDGRLKFSGMTEMKHPYIIPANEQVVTTLLIMNFHNQLLHAGVSHTLASIRSSGYWIVRGRNLVKKTLKSCVVCRIWKARPAHQCMAPLPPERITSGQPFQTVGIDFAGPLYIRMPKCCEHNWTKKHSDTTKMYICLFTCATTRGVHLELAQDLSAEAFLNCFRRFIARRGTPELVISDNGRNLEKGQKDIERFQKSVKHDRTKEFSTAK